MYWRTSMHPFRRSLAIAAMLATSLVGTSGLALATSGASAVLGHVYVNNNTAGHNSVSGFDRGNTVQRGGRGNRESHGIGRGLAALRRQSLSPRRRCGSE